MTYHPEQQQINQYVKWLVYSKPGASALVPCTTYNWADWLMRGTIDTIAATFGKSDYLRVSLPRHQIETTDRGRLVFIVPRHDNVRGIVWDHIFSLSGPYLSGVQSLEIEEVLNRITTRKEAIHATN